MTDHTLAQALAVASKYWDDEGPYAMVQLGGGYLRAGNGISGVMIRCDIANIDVAVDGKQLHRITKVISRDATIEKKGRKLVVEDEKSFYEVSVAAKAAAPTFPDPPDEDWKAATAEQIDAIACVAELVDRHLQPPMDGLRLTPSWVACGTLAYVAIAWVSGVVNREFVIPPLVFQKVSGAADLCVDGLRLWVRGDYYVWTVGLDGEYPDAALLDQVNKARAAVQGNPDAVITQAPVDELRDLSRRAAAVALTPADCWKLEAGETGSLTISGGSQATFTGQLHGKLLQGKEGMVGIGAPVLGKIAKAVEGVQGESVVSVSQPMDPVILVCGNPPVEVVISPVYLDS